MNFRIVFKILGLLAVLIGVTMGFCWGFAWWDMEQGFQTTLENYAHEAMGKSMLISIGVGLLLFLLGLGGKPEVLRREAILIVGLSWIEVSFLGMLPYLLCTQGLGFFDAFFESVSGFTTTGSSIMSDIESFPRAILLWRSVTQWLGGIGILVVFVAVLSFLGAGSKSLIAQESSLNISDSRTSRIRDVAFALLKVYLILTVVCTIGLILLGMPEFEAVCHAMCTIATGGFSPMNLSIGHYQDLGIEIWIGLFMFLSSIGFMLYVFVVTGNWKRLRKEEEAKYYLILVLVAILAIALDLMLASTHFGYRQALRDGFFNVISISSTTGFGVSDYSKWPLFSQILLMLLMLIGGCAGSTAGGIKMNRVILYLKTAQRELVRSFRPTRVFRIRLNGIAPDERALTTTSFFIALGFVISGAACVVVSLLEPDLNMISTIGCVFATLFNIGPGFEAVGPTENFGFLNPATKMVLSFLMILGRLEFFALLVLFVPSLWKKY
ncbi:MAG: TrkH family potassium uptake protein [Verrucomicrobiales bacterium]|nr:TrkH family potassium uptake protein [Verrucomicrobiales bacterium]